MVVAFAFFDVLVIGVALFVCVMFVLCVVLLMLPKVIPRLQCELYQPRSKEGQEAPSEQIQSTKCFSAAAWFMTHVE